MPVALKNVLPSRILLVRILVVLSPMLVFFLIRDEPPRAELVMVRMLTSDERSLSEHADDGYQSTAEFRLTNATGSPIYLVGDSIDDLGCGICSTDEASSHLRSRFSGRHRVYAGGPGLRLEPGDSFLLFDSYLEEPENPEDLPLNYAVIWYAHEPFGMSEFETVYNEFLRKVGLGNWCIGGDTHVFPAATKPFQLKGRPGELGIQSRDAPLELTQADSE